jgi:hypothetical protein
MLKIALTRVMVVKEPSMSKFLKFGIIVLAGLCLALLALILIGVPLDSSLAENVETEVASESAPSSNEDLIQALQDALELATGKWTVFDYIIDHIQVEDDGQVALVWLAAVEIESGEPLGREPELALAELQADGTWVIHLEDSEPFDDKFRNFQYAEKSMVGDLIDESQAQPKSSRVFGGYYLPWAAGLEKRLTWSVAHTSCTPTYYCTHAFDFADGTMFPMVASKGGTVYHWKDTCANGNSSCTNSITLEDRSTTPWTYQIYLHIAQGSVPNNLKKVGAPVLQGQYIADVDDTGYSSGHHVHFMVVAENTRYMSWNGYVWGVAEDITFRDVDINWDSATQGGRPRLKYEADSYGGQGRTYYISGNQPAHPPTGGLTAPATKTHITNRQFTVTGWGQDDISVTKYEILAKYETDWVTIKEVSGGTSFSTTVDLCETDIPDGPFKLALRVWDYEGNPSSVRTERKLIKDVECGASGTDPQVTLQKRGEKLVLPGSGFVGADVTKGSTNSAITVVEFWFHGPSWTNNNWVYLGKDQNGSNGWQAPISTSNWPEGSNYTILAVATDSAGNQDVDVVFNAIVDKTPPSLIIDSVSSPVRDDQVTLRWTASDSLAGLDYFVLRQKLNSNDYVILNSAIPMGTRTYTVPVEGDSIMIFELIAYDQSGNAASQKTSLYTLGYEFPFNFVFPFFLNQE